MSYTTIVVALYCYFDAIHLINDTGYLFGGPHTNIPKKESDTIRWYRVVEPSYELAVHMLNVLEWSIIELDAFFVEEM